MKPAIQILGIRGLPANHGGFETFAEKLASHLVQQGWQVDVYCQDDGGTKQFQEVWCGINLIHIPVRLRGSAGSFEFDVKCALHALKNPRALILTLGYNTAILSVLYRLFGRMQLMNMDGLEWKRSKWPLPIKAWFYLNERLGCRLANHLIADHPDIKTHLATRVAAGKITMIPYGGDRIAAPAAPLPEQLGLRDALFALVVARPEPENSILEIVRAFSSKRRNVKLVVLGSYAPERNDYQRKVMEAASTEVLFPGAIYDKRIVQTLRGQAVFYLHGHQVGGTNPSLVEALGAGSAIIAHDNPFNRWVARDGACYFADVEQCAASIDRLLTDADCLSAHRKASLARFEDVFQWERILRDYEDLIKRWHRPALHSAAGSGYTMP